MRQGWKRAALALWAAVSVVAVQGCLTPPVEGFSTIAYPLGKAEGVIVGMPTCGGGAGIGPVGLLHDGTSMFVSDWCNAATYRYSVGPTVPWPLASAAVNGLTNGLALRQGEYFGIAGLHQSIVESGIYQFDPLTLQLGRLITPAPCRDTRGLATDPVTGALFVTGDCGLWRINDIDGPLATITPIVKATDLDGVAVTEDGQVWAVDVTGKSVGRYDTQGKLIASWPIVDVPIGVAIAPRSAPTSIRGAVFTNNADGVVTMVDIARGARISQVALGGSRGDFAAFGPDGHLYVTQPNRVERFTYASSSGPPLVMTGPRRVPYPLLLACALLALTCGALIVVRRLRYSPGH